MPRLLNFVAEDVFNELLPVETVMDYVQQQWYATEEPGS